MKVWTTRRHISRAEWRTHLCERLTEMGFGPEDRVPPSAVVEALGEDYNIVEIFGKMPEFTRLRRDLEDALAPIQAEFREKRLQLLNDGWGDWQPIYDDYTQKKRAAIARVVASAEAL